MMQNNKKTYESNMNSGNRTVIFVVFLCLLSIQFMPLDALAFMSVPYMFVMIGLLVFNMMLRRDKILLINGHLWIFFSFFAVFLSALISINLTISFQYTAYYILFGLVFVLLSFRMGWQSICLKIQLIFSIIHVTITILSSFFPAEYYALVLPLYSVANQNLIHFWMQNSNYPGIAGQLGTNSFFISIGIAIVVAKLFVNKTKKRGIQLFLLLIMIYALFLTGKRGMLIGNIVAILSVWYVGPLGFKKTRLFKVFLALVVIIVSLYLLSIFIPVLEQTIGRFLYNWGDADFSSGRMDLYREALQLFSQKYLFGYGINTYTTLSVKGFNTSVGAHNDLLQFMAEMGIVGAIIYFIPIMWIFTKTIQGLRLVFNKQYAEQIYKYRQFFLASLYIQILILFYSMIGNPFHYYNMLFIYMIFGAIPVSMGLEIKREKRKGLL